MRERKEYYLRKVMPSPTQSPNPSFETLTLTVSNHSHRRRRRQRNIVIARRRSHLAAAVVRLEPQNNNHFSFNRRSLAA
ncbi:hypothetical protein AKJ16_DCAP09522 [Drosera capensis]